jgi:hypothetical protein
VSIPAAFKVADTAPMGIVWQPCAAIVSVTPGTLVFFIDVVRFVDSSHNPAFSLKESNHPDAGNALRPDGHRRTQAVRMYVRHHAHHRPNLAVVQRST